MSKRKEDDTLDQNDSGFLDALTELRKTDDSDEEDYLPKREIRRPLPPIAVHSRESGAY